MRTGRLTVLLGIAYALAGCGASASQDVQAKLQQFAHAVASRDAKTLCNQVLDPALVAHVTRAGLSCDSAMKTFTESVTDPNLSVSKVKVTGSTATAAVLATARGQQAAVEIVHLTNTKHGWRLSSLASPG